jgi:hypothetical protein
VIRPVTYKDSDKVFVVCTGPSLKGFDFERLRGQHVIAVTNAFKFVPDFDCLVAIDWQFYAWNFEELSKLDRIAYAVKEYFEDPIMYNMGKMKVEFLERTGFEGIDYNDGCVRFGGNSGYTALNIAIHLGAKDIRILGMDLSMEDPKKPYFFVTDEKYSYQPHDIAHLNHMTRYFHTFVEDMKPDVKVTNYSMQSKITVFPKKELSEILED